MAEYIPTPVKWVRDQIELYEGSGGTQGTELGGRPVIIVTHRGNRSGAIRKTALMRVEYSGNYVLVGSMGGAPKNPVWVYNLRADADVEIRDKTEVHRMRVRKWKMPTNGRGSGGWPSKPSRPTRSTRTRPRGRSPYSSPNRTDRRGARGRKRPVPKACLLRRRPRRLNGQPDSVGLVRVERRRLGILAANLADDEDPQTLRRGLI